MRKILAQFLVLSLLIGFPGTLHANDFRWIWQDGEKKWQSHFETEYEPGNHERNTLVLSPFVTLAQNDHSLIFMNIRNTLFWQDSDFAHEINLGGGYRRLMGEGNSWILGGYAFYDRLDSLFDNKFNQGTLGIEALSQDWDLRMNGYISDMDQEFVGSTGQKVQLVGTQLTMNGTVEQSMSGLDGEVGWRLPFATDGVLGDTRVYAGGFFFDASKVSSIVGPSTRFETRIHDVPFLWEGSRITVGAQYTWDDTRNSNVTGLISLRIPFGAPSRTQPLSYVERRMTDRVVRDVAVVTDLGAGSSESVVTRTGAPIEEAYFFDEDSDSPDCTFENPCDIDTAIDTGANNLLIGLNRTGDVDLGGSNHQLFDGQTVMGGGSGLVVIGKNSGQSFTFYAPGGPATLYRGDGGTGLMLAQNNTIEGLTFRAMETALYLDSALQSSMVDIYNNNFRNLVTGIDLNVTNSALTAYVTNNLFEDQGTGIDVQAGGTFDVDLQVRGNIFREMGTGIYADLNPTGETGPSSWNDAIHDNRFEGMDSGIDVDVFFQGSENYAHTSSVYENYFRSLDRDDYELDLSGKAPSGEIDLRVNLTENRSEDGDNFFDFEMDPIPNGQVDLQIVDNDIEDVEDTAIDIYIDQGPDVTANISGNRIENVMEGDAIEVDITRSGDENGHTLTIANNEIRDVYNDGIDVYFGYGYDADVSITGNDIAEIGDDEEDSDQRDAIRVAFYENGHDQGDTAEISNNTINDVDDDGIDADFGYGYDGTLTVADNQITDVRGNGVEVDFEGNGHDQGNTATVSRNMIGETGHDGIDVDFRYGYDSTVTIADNVIEDVGEGEDGGDGINVDFSQNGNEGGPGDTATITGNSVDRSEDDGIDVQFQYSENDTSVTIADNTLSSLEGDGIFVDFNGNEGSSDSATITRNTISDAGDDGIDVEFDYGPDATLMIAHNTIDRVDDNGITINLYDTSGDTGNTVTVTRNEITDADANGIDVYTSYSDDTDVMVTNNAITNVGDSSDGADGIRVAFRENGHDVGDTATITGNTIDEAEDDGIDVYFGYGYDGTATVANNRITDVGGDGIEVDFDKNGHDVGNTASVTNNTVEGAGGDGIDVGFDYDDASITISNNVISDSESGIAVALTESVDVTAAITGNRITDVERDGIDVYLSDTEASLVTISGNRVTGSGIRPFVGMDCGGCGVLVRLENDSNNNEIVINGNTVAHSDYTGIAGSAINSSDTNTFRIGGNSVDESDVYGISFVSESASNTITSQVNGSTQNNTVQNSGIEDTYFDGPFTGTIRVNGVDVP